MTLYIDIRLDKSVNLNSPGMVDLRSGVANDEISSFQSLVIGRTITLTTGTPNPSGGVFNSAEDAFAYYSASDAAAIVTDLNTRSTNVYTLRDIVVGISKAQNDALRAITDYIVPGAHIGDATNNLATNYNLVSGVLGVANGLNSANTAQNDLANKFNTLLDELQANNLISP